MASESRGRPFLFGGLYLSIDKLLGTAENLNSVGARHFAFDEYSLLEFCAAVNKDELIFKFNVCNCVVITTHYIPLSPINVINAGAAARSALAWPPAAGARV